MKALNRTPEQLASLRTKLQPFLGRIATSYFHIAAVKADGTVLTADGREFRDHYRDPKRVERMAGVVGISTGEEHTIGLLRNGKAMDICEYCEYDCGQVPVEDWEALVDVKAAGHYSVGLTRAGEIVAYGSMVWNHLCGVEKWRDIVAISPSETHLLALHRDGTVENTDVLTRNEQLDTANWNGIVAISAGSNYSVGLKADGTVVTCKSSQLSLDDYGQAELSHWRDIVAVQAGLFHTVGIRADGTVVAAGCNEEGQCNVEHWRNIFAVAAGFECTVGLRADGTVVVAGETRNIMDEISGWKLF